MEMKLIHRKRNTATVDAKAVKMRQLKESLDAALSSSSSDDDEQGSDQEEEAEGNSEGQVSEDDENSENVEGKDILLLQGD